MTFTPAMALPPSTGFRVVVPAGRRGVRSAAGRLLPRPFVVRFRTGKWSRLRFEQLLAQLGYLPVSWALAGVNTAPAGAAAQLAAAYDPPAGTFSWNPGYPASQRPV